MRVLIVQPDRKIDENEIDLEFLFDRMTVATLNYDDGHDILYDDEALSHPGLCYGKIGIHPKVPLPAYVVGVEGEEFKDATLAIESLAETVD